MASEDKDKRTERSKRKIADQRLIEVDKPGEVAFWTKWFGASEAELREAIGKVGDSAQRVALYFETLRRQK